MRATRSLPSLNALRVFEAAARHASFAQAADELHVTPGAVSHQIASLEDSLGTELFRRGTRSVTLTPAGRAFLPKLSEGFAALREAVDALDLESGGAERVLTVSVAPAFATRWLLPRLPRFTTEHPDISLSLSTGLGLIDVVRPDASATLGETSDHGAKADLAIRFGRGDYPGHRSDQLLAATVTPVCSPALLRGEHPLKSPRDLQHHVLIHDDTVYFDDPRPDWTVWMEAAGIAGLPTQRGPHFSHTALALDAAEDGLGVALGLSVLTDDDIQAKRLAAPFPITLPTPFGYWLACAEDHCDRPDVMAFRAWLLHEARGVEIAASA